MSIFREYDIRGIFEEDLNKEKVIKIGYLLGNYIKKHDNKVAIGYDARTHSPILFEWLGLGLMLHGVEVYNLGMIPTPVAYFSTFHTDIKNSVMITGSHNPPQYNGFKITINQSPFYGNEIQNLGKEMDTLDIRTPDIESHKKEPRKIDVLQDYIDFISKEFYFLKGWSEKIVFDCGNGVASLALKQILENLQLDTINLFFEPDGTFPNHHPDPSEEKNLVDLKRTLQENHISIGIAYDGDADRVALVSPNHNFKGDELAILFARDIAKTKKNPIVIGEVKCSQIMYDEINKIGSSVMYKTGHSNLKVKLKELHADLACEMSGHIFFNDRYFGYDDAIYAGFRILELLYKEKEDGNNNPISKLEKSLLALPKTYNTNEEKILTTEDKKFESIKNLKCKLDVIWESQKGLHTDSQVPKDFPKIKDVIDIDGVRVIFENGWGLIRASNTTPTLVTRFEAYSQSDLESYKQCLLNLLVQ
ncbi:phosphomannomutase/phosphoglucomutase [Helicobacter didelphidarum]|uniref:Phosphomannomutase/phosphoglucomutase n=1 Tax=Helicobacter didelphidarum TaxID=2040648 RepID=A0A3D8IC56_9HELI|nr:phosphomannomutase/phosphoglucomutase [Helicobacter didelphidarum]RDU62698.1 phosphomannomutase/phosphoglucomutase [Helicobacter didelphidarum]